MRLNKSYDINRLRDYSSLFSRSEAIQWYDQNWSSLRVKIERHDRGLLQKNCSYLSYLKHVYKILERFYPNEYVYKNEFISQWLLHEIGIDGSILFNEFRLGKAVADLAMFNGVSKVFEIKTMLDKEARLSHQLAQYSRLFNELYVIVPESKVAIYLKRDVSIGVITYLSDNRNFQLVRKATHRLEMDVNVLMQVLHTHEYIKIVEQYYGECPAFNDFTKFRVCEALIREIPAEALNPLFITAMKERKICNVFSSETSQFNQLFLSLNYSAREQQQLLYNLRSTIC